MIHKIAQENMIKQQLRACKVLDLDILELIENTPREQFVPKAFQSMAYADQRIPLGYDETMMTPEEEGRILQALAILPDERVLEVGTGSGYLTALLAQQAKQVYSLDVIPEFTQQASQKCSAFGITNIIFDIADGVNGLPSKAPFDVIVLTGSLPSLPAQLKDQLAIGGRLFAIEGEGRAMTAYFYRHLSEKSWEKQSLFDTCIKSLQHQADVIFKF